MLAFDMKFAKQIACCVVLLLHSAASYAQEYGLPMASPGTLHWAADLGDEGDVIRLVEAGTAVDVRAATRSEATPLHYAARSGHYAIARFLVERGADVSAQTNFGDTPLHFAAASYFFACVDIDRGDSEGLAESYFAIAQLLIDSGAPVDSRNRAGTTPLQNAATCNDVAIADLLIANGANVNNRSRRHSVLSRALAWGPDVARLLIENGAEVNDFMPFGGETPLIAAVSHNRSELVRLLLEAGADPNNRHPQTQSTALDYAVYTCKSELVEILLQYGAMGRAKIAENGMPEMPTSCPEHPQRISIDRPLHDAVRSGDAETVEQLIQSRIVAINEPGLGGRMPLHEISHAPSMRVAQLLIESGADVEARDDLGQTPLSLVAYRAYLDGAASLAEFLVSNGADVNSHSEGGYTPLYNATSGPGDELEMVRLLIDRGADVNARTEDGSTALHVAAREGKAARAELLIEHGADVNARNSRRDTPLGVANGRGVRRLLREHGGAR